MSIPHFMNGQGANTKCRGLPASVGNKLTIGTCHFFEQKLPHHLAFEAGGI